MRAAMVGAWLLLISVPQRSSAPLIPAENEMSPILQRTCVCMRVCLRVREGRRERERERDVCRRGEDCADVST